MLQYNNFLAKYIALCLLKDGDRSSSDMSIAIHDSGIITLEYFDELIFFGVFRELITKGWVTKYTKTNADGLKTDYYHLTEEGAFYVSPYHAKLKDIYTRLEKFYTE